MFLALNNVHLLSFLHLPYHVFCCFLIFLTALSRIYVLLPCFLFACLLACFFSLVYSVFRVFQWHRVFRYCPSLFSKSVFPVISFVLFQCFPFCLSVIILPSLINLPCQFFPSLHIFSSGDPIFFPQNNQPLSFIFVYLSFSWLLFPEVDKSSLLLKYLNI